MTRPATRSLPAERPAAWFPNQAPAPSDTAPVPVLTRNPAMLLLLERLARVAAANSVVLITGESGTGKEVIARAIHQGSPRSQAPFVRLNCAALPEGVLESELFGHERGAFTGAVRQHAGRFELADGGTLLLDEIGAADPRVQLRLLRVLQEHEFERVGGTQTLRVDVRVIAATNADLLSEVRLGRFREDLFYRLSVVPLHVPPLRERRDDIPMLAEHFMARAARRNQRSACRLAPAAVERLQAGDWPGNVRQLENVIERMVVLATHDVLTSADVPEEVGARPAAVAGEPGDVPFHEARALFERHFLCQALARHHGIITQVADAIGMSRKNLYMKLDSLHIDYDRYRL
jgi:transcriptional regulator with GAF, ATPase, and Fis domain